MIDLELVKRSYAWSHSGRDVPALIAEVERLREQVREIGQITREWMESGVERTADVWEVLARRPDNSGSTDPSPTNTQEDNRG